MCALGVVERGIITAGFFAVLLVAPVAGGSAVEGGSDAAPGARIPLASTKWFCCFCCCCSSSSSSLCSAFLRDSSGELTTLKTGISRPSEKMGRPSDALLCSLGTTGISRRRPYQNKGHRRPDGQQRSQRSLDRRQLASPQGGSVFPCDSLITKNGCVYDQ